MLPDRSILVGQKLAENAHIGKFKCDILGDFETLCDAIVCNRDYGKSCRSREDTDGKF